MLAAGHSVLGMTDDKCKVSDIVSADAAEGKPAVPRRKVIC